MSPSKSVVASVLVCMLVSALALPSCAELGVGTRAVGMGGAFTAIADDPSASYWNPAGLAKVNSFHFQPPNAQVRIDSKLDWRDVADNPPTDDEERLELLKELGQGSTGLEFSANLGFVTPGFAVSVIPVVNAELEADIDIDPATGDPRIVMIGGVPTVPSSGLITGVATAAVGVSVARQLKDGSSVGVTVKSMRSVSFDQPLHYTAVADAGEPSGYRVVDDSPDATEIDRTGLGIDFGYLRSISPSTSFGVMVRNLIEPGIPGDFAQRRVNLGVAHAIADGKVLLAADIASVFDHPTLNLGAEFRAGKFLNIWAGLYERKPTLGLGTSLLGLKLQVAYSPRNTSIMSASILF